MIDIEKKISTPEWKERRSEILRRDRFKCTVCGSSYCTLNVHHLEYLPGRAYWDYPDELLITVCRSCHQKIHGKKEGKLKRSLDEVVEEIKDRKRPQKTDVEVSLQMSNHKVPRPMIMINGKESIVYEKSHINPRFGLVFNVKHVRGKDRKKAREDILRLAEYGLISDFHVDIFILEDILPEQLKQEYESDRVIKRLSDNKLQIL